MAPHDISPRLLQFAIAWKILSMEGPIRVSVQLLPTLIEAVDRQEEGLRIGSVDRHRHLQGSDGLPHEVETRIVDTHPLLASLLAPEKTKGLEYLQPFRAGLVCVLDPVGLELGVPRIGRPGPCRFGEDDETAGVRGLQFADRVAQTRAIASRHVHHGPNVLAVHDGKTIRRIHAEADRARIPAARGEGDVSVKVDHRKSGARHVRLGNVKHALRLISLQRQGGVLGRAPCVPCLRPLRRLFSRGAAVRRESAGAERHPLPAVHGSRSFWRSACIHFTTPSFVSQSRYSAPPPRTPPRTVPLRSVWTYNGSAEVK